MGSVTNREALAIIGQGFTVAILPHFVAILSFCLLALLAQPAARRRSRR
jgi:hypothetical protein